MRNPAAVHAAKERYRKANRALINARQNARRLRQRMLKEAKRERDRKRAQTPEYKAKNRARCKTPEYRLKKKVRRELSRARAEYQPPIPPPRVHDALLRRLQQQTGATQ